MRLGFVHNHNINPEKMRGRLWEFNKKFFKKHRKTWKKPITTTVTAILSHKNFFKKGAWQIGNFVVYYSSAKNETSFQRDEPWKLNSEFFVPCWFENNKSSDLETSKKQLRSKLVKNYGTRTRNLLGRTFWWMTCTTLRSCLILLESLILAQDERWRRA